MALESLTLLIEKRLNELVVTSSSPEQQLFEAARYTLLNPGKRLRPLLTLATAEAFGAGTDTALDPACAIEMIHTYSLIHDDLPCMDDDNMRRGMPTLHRIYSEGHAVLTGDFLLTYAFEVIADAPYLTAEQKLDLISTLSKAAGGAGMVRGQVLDIAFEGKTIDLSLLEYIHHSKTSTLMTAALEFGAICGNATLKQREIIREFGSQLGLAFQILDDLRDDGQEVKEKTTIVSILGTEEAKKRLEKLTISSLEMLSGLGIPTSRLVDLTHWILAL